jgi:Cation transporter/ATPase, N-terminus
MNSLPPQTQPVLVGRARTLSDVRLTAPDITQARKRVTISLGDMNNYKTRGRVIAPPRQTVDLLYKQGREKVAAVQPQLEDVDEHMISIDTLLQRYNVSVDQSDPARSMGLTSAEAQHRLDTEGPNALSPGKEANAFIQYVKLLKDPLIIMLMVTAVLSIISQVFAVEGDFTPTYLGVVLFVVSVASYPYTHAGPVF